MEAPAEWVAPIEDLTYLDKDTAKFIFESAEKRLKHLLDVSDRTTNRAIFVLTAAIPFVGFLLSALFKHYLGQEDNCLRPELLILCWISVIVSLVSATVMTVVAFPRNMHQMGRDPQLLFVKEFVENSDYQGAEQYKLFLVDGIEDFKQRIDFMQCQNNRRIRLFKIGFLLLGCYAGLCFTTVIFWAVSLS